MGKSEELADIDTCTFIRRKNPFEKPEFGLEFKLNGFEISG